MSTSPDEPERLKALAGYEILDTPAEAGFDDLARLAAWLCGTPIGLVSLIDERRQWFKAHIGLEIRETPRDQAFCAHALEVEQPLVVTDAQRDARFAQNPLVTGPPHIRFYAGAPLRTPSGHSLGTLCVIDRVPRQLSEQQLAALVTVSREVVSRLELRRHVRELGRALARHESVERERRHVESLQAMQHGATVAFSEGPTFDDAMPKALQAMATARGWRFASFWRRDPRGVGLRCVATWSADPTASAALDVATRAAPCARGVGLPGRVWDSGSVLYLADLDDDPNFLRAPVARAAGLHKALGAPVSLGGDLLGVLEFLAPEMPAPDAELLRALASLGALVAQFVERDASDEALRSNDAHMHSVIENMLEGLLVVDESGLIESVNPAAEQIFGYPTWEIVGQPLKVLLPRSVSDRAEQFLADAYKRAIGRVTEWEGRRKNGEVFRFELSLYEFWSPKGRRLAGHVRDISDRQRLEKMKKEFVATVSHELRTPLTSIRGSLSLLASGVLGELPADAKEAVEIAERNTVRLIGLINDILDLERIESGKMEIRIAPLALATVFERSLEGVRGMAETMQITVEVEPTQLRVDADEERLVQVVVNLLSNAIKFSPRGETVRVASRAEDGWAEVRVSDHGRGIPESYREAIFERFQQVESSDSRQKGGSGLGLAICKAIVEHHGGTIGVESERGKGSTFHFRVPLEGATLPVAP